jgi:integrating conjugative element protein (TIGR03757 family)
MTGGGAVTVYDLSAASRVLDSLGRGLPGDHKAAAAIASSRLAASAGALRTAYAGHAKAAEYGIEKIPAVVFDGGSSVVYGITDLQEALRIYRRWEAGQP